MSTEYFSCFYANNNYRTIPSIRGKTLIDFTRIDCHEEEGILSAKYIYERHDNMVYKG